MAFSLPLFISVWDPDSQDSDATFLVGLLSLFSFPGSTLSDSQASV